MTPAGLRIVTASSPRRSTTLPERGMLELEARYRRLPGTRAAVGQAGEHCVIADRPEGRAGGGGGGFNGGQLLALSLGACYCNDLQYTAEAMGVAIEDLDIEVLLDFGGAPAVAAEIGRTHANLLHHLGSAAGLQAALARSTADRLNASIAEAVERAQSGEADAREIVGRTIDDIGNEGA